MPLYKFLVECQEPSIKVVGVYRYGDIDPGREVARTILARRYGNTHKQVQITDYHEPRRDFGDNLQEEEFNAQNVDGEQLQRLVNGDIQAVLEIAFGVGATVVSGATDAAGGVAKAVKDFINKPFG